MLEQIRLDKYSAAEIDFYLDPAEDYCMADPLRVLIGALHNPFSASLRIFSQNLSTLVLDGFVDLTLF